MPLVSVVIPSYNTGWCIQTAINSVLSQSFAGFELIVVDDGSSDDTASRVAAIPDPRLQYCYQPNAGRAAARNTGIQRATGEWLAFLDADDLWLPGKLSIQLAALQANPSCIMTYSQVAVFTARDAVGGVPPDLSAAPVRGSGVAGAADVLGAFLLAQADVVTSTVMARRSAIVAMGGFDSRHKVAEDWDLFLRLARRGPVVYIPQVLAAYWQGPYRNAVERAQTDGGHLELLAAVQEVITSSALAASDPALASQSLAVWQWLTALIEFRLARTASARQHADASAQARPGFLRGEQAAELLANHILDMHGRALPLPQFMQDAQTVLAALVPAADRHTLCRKSVAYLHATRAFDAYRAGALRGGFAHALNAMRWNSHWTRNRGLWLVPLRAAVSRRR